MELESSCFGMEGSKMEGGLFNSVFNSVTSRGVRDRFTLILRRYKARNAKEANTIY